MTDDTELLVSAYLDGQASADERARVEADPVLSAEVEQLRLLRAQLAPEPAPISMREDQLAAALAAWDRLPDAERLGLREEGADPTTMAAASAMSGPARGPSRRRWLLGAAAALVVVVGAGVILQQVDPADNDDSSAEPAADAEAADAAESPAEEDGDPTDRAAAIPERELAQEESAEDLTAIDIEAESRALEAIEEEGGSADELTHSADTPDQGPPPEEGVNEYPELRSQEDLIAYAGLALGVTGTTVPLDELLDDESAASPTTVLAPCGDFGIDVLVGPALYFGQVVMVGLDRDDGFAIAYDPVGCTLVESLPVPD